MLVNETAVAKKVAARNRAASRSPVTQSAGSLTVPWLEFIEYLRVLRDRSASLGAQPFGTNVLTEGIGCYGVNVKPERPDHIEIGATVTFDIEGIVFSDVKEMLALVRCSDEWVQDAESGEIARLLLEAMGHTPGGSKAMSPKDAADRRSFGDAVKKAFGQGG